VALITLLYGANPNLLGQREPHIYVALAVEAVAAKLSAS
jgi:3-dehydroquinate dehydratase